MNSLDVLAYYSVKGGVGKTTLAVAAALGLAPDRPVAFLDCDFMGSSIADGLRLEAPDLRNGDKLDLNAKSAPFFTATETRERRRSSPATLPFLDDLLFGRKRRFRAQTVAWRHPLAPGVCWYPSSPTITASSRAARGLLGPTWRQAASRLHDAIRSVGDTLGPRGIVVVDLPPAFYGTPTIMSELLLGDPSIRFVPVLVSTPDRDDLYRSVEIFFNFELHFRWILNRNRGSVTEARTAVREYLGEQWKLSGVERQLHDVGWSDALSSVFQEDGLDLPTELVERVLRLSGLH